MKNKKLIYSILVLLTGYLFTVALTGRQTANSSASNSEKLNLKVSGQKPEYILGEKIQLNTEVFNESSQDILSTDSLAKSCAYLYIYVSKDNKTYKEYFGPEFQIEGCEINLLLKFGESYKTQTFLLWNGVPEFNQIYEPTKNLRTIPGFAIRQTGVYFIKAVLKFSEEAKLENIESEPIQVVVNEPTGDELEIWNRIKDKGENNYEKFICFFYFVGN